MSNFPHFGENELSSGGVSGLPIPNGTWYMLEVAREVTWKVRGTFWLPVCGDTNPSIQFSHNYTQGDDMVKKTADIGMSALRGFGGQMGGKKGVISAAGSSAINLGYSAAASQMQVRLGAKIAGTVSGIYSTSAPDQLQIQTKLISAKGSGVLKLVNQLRYLTSAHILEGVSGRHGTLGILNIPAWFNVSIISDRDNGPKVLYTAKNLVCTAMGITFYAPYLDEDPCYTELSMNMQGLLPAIADNVNIGSNTI